MNFNTFVKQFRLLYLITMFIILATAIFSINDSSYDIKVTSDYVFSNIPFYLEAEMNDISSLYLDSNNVDITSVTCSNKVLPILRVNDHFQILNDIDCNDDSIIEVSVKSDKSSLNNISLNYYVDTKTNGLFSISQNTTKEKYPVLRDSFFLSLNFKVSEYKPLSTLIYRDFKGDISDLSFALMLGHDSNLKFILKTNYQDNYFECNSDKLDLGINKSNDLIIYFSESKLSFNINKKEVGSCIIPGEIISSSNKFITKDFRLYGELYDFKGNVSDVILVNKSFKYDQKGVLNINISNTSILSSNNKDLKDNSNYINSSNQNVDLVDDINKDKNNSINSLENNTKLKNLSNESFQDKNIDQVINNSINDKKLISDKKGFTIKELIKFSKNSSYKDLFKEYDITNFNGELKLVDDIIETGKNVTWNISLESYEDMIYLPFDILDLNSTSDIKLIINENNYDKEILFSEKLKSNQIRTLKQDLEKLNSKNNSLLENMLNFLPSTIKKSKIKSLENEKLVKDDKVLIDIKGSKEVILKTEAPLKRENEVSKYNKNITISSKYHYKNVLTSTKLSIETPIDNIKLYWYKEDGSKILFKNITYIDSNNNSLIDEIKWLVPHLSNQTFELDLRVLNVQSYPQLGDNWKVEFTTNGVGDLFIRGVNGTTFGDNYPDDLKLKGLFCGDDKVNLEEIIDTVTNEKYYYVQDYECRNISYEVSQVNTLGKHYIEFSFGTKDKKDKDYARNYAYVLNEDFEDSFPGDWIVDQSPSSYTIEVSTNQAHSPSNSLRFNTAWASGTRSGSISKTIDASNVCGLYNLTLYCGKSWSAGTTVYVEFDDDGDGNDNWVELGNYDPNNCDWSLGTEQRFDITSVEPKSNLKFRLRLDITSGSSGDVFVDDIQITGEDDCPPPINTDTLTPINETNYDDSYLKSVDLICNGSTTNNLVNVSLFITDINNNNFRINETRSISGLSHTEVFTKNLDIGNYTWNCLFFDDANYFAWGENKTLYQNYTDLVSPWFTHSFPNQNLEYGSSYFYDVNATDNNIFDSYSINDIRFNIDSDGLITNNTRLFVGTYNLRVDINDTFSNYNYSTFILTVQDTVKPEFTDADNITLNDDQNLKYDFNASDISGIDTWSINDSVRFKINSSTGVLENNTYLSAGNYSIRVSVLDNNGVQNSINIKVKIIDIDFSSPNVLLTSPIDGFILYDEVIDLNISVTDDYLVDRCHLWTNTSGVWEVNSSINSINSPSKDIYWSLDNLGYEPFKWNVECCDVKNKCSFGIQNRTFVSKYIPKNSIIDDTYFDIIRPSNNWVDSDRNVTINVKVDTGIINIQACNLYLNGDFVYQDNNLGNGIKYNSLENNGNYNWSISCIGFDEFNITHTFNSRTYNFSVDDTSSNVDFFEHIEDASGNSVETTIEIYNTVNKVLLNSTTSKIHELSIPRSSNIDIIIKPLNSPIKKVEFENLDPNVGLSELVDLDKTAIFGFTQTYAINPKFNDFTEATVTVVAKGNKVSKCVDWNYETASCYGEWVHMMDITPGQEYTFKITPTDPGFGEYTSSKEKGFITQSGIVQVTGTMTQKTITPVNDMSKAFVILSRGIGDLPVHNSNKNNNQVWVRGDLSSSSQLTFNRQSANEHSYISYQVIEAVSDEFRVFRGSGSFGQGNGEGLSWIELPIGGDVDPSSTISLVYTDSSDTGRNYGDQSLVTAHMVNNTHLRLERVDGGNTVINYNWQVVEFNTDFIDGIYTGEITANGNEEANPAIANIGATVNLTTSLLLWQHRTDINGIVHGSMAGRFESNSQVGFYDFMVTGAPSGNDIIRWFVIDFGKYATKKESGQIDYSADQNWYEHEVTLSSQYQHNKTISFVGHATDGTNTGSAYPRSFHMWSMPDTQTFRMERGRYGQESYLEYQVMELKYIVDTLGPVINQTNPKNDTYNDTFTPINVTFSCNATDDFNVVKNISLYITDKFNTRFEYYDHCSLDRNPANCEWNLTLENGDYTWNCLAYDSVDNLAWGKNYFFKINFTDLEPPKFNHTLDNFIIELGDSFSYDINATDNFAFDSYSVNDSTNFKINNNTGLLENNTFLSFGSYKLNVTINDTAGNINSSTMNIIVNDTIKPELLLIDNITELINNPINRQFFASDVGGIFGWFVNDTVNFNINETGHLVNNTYLVSGMYYINITVYDNYGNYNYENIWVNITNEIDNILPWFDPIPNNQTAELARELKYRMYPKDNILLSSVTVNDSRFKISPIYELMNNSYLDVGIYHLNISLVDSSSNRNYSLLYVNVTDTVAPTIDYVESQVINVYNDLGVQFIANDPSGIKSWYVNDSRFKINSTGYLENNTLLSVGNYSLRIKINDTYDNEQSKNIYVLVTDVTKPWFNPLPTNQNYELGDSISYTIFGQDDVAVDSYSVNNIRFKISSFGVLENNSLVQDGIYQLNVTVNDTSGNDNYTLFNITIVDTTVPEINNVFNITAEQYSLINADFDAFDYSGILSWQVNDSNFSITSDGILSNNGDLEVGIYYLEINVTDNNGFSNQDNIWVNITSFTGIDGWKTQHGEARLNGQDTIINIDPIIPSQSFILLSMSGSSSYDEPQMVSMWPEFIDSSRFVIHRNGNYGSDSNYVGWQVISNKYIKAQHMSTTFALSDLSKDITLTQSVDPSKSIVVIQYGNNSETNPNSFPPSIFTGEIINGNTVRIKRLDNGLEATVGFSVVEFNDGSIIQKGAISNLGTTPTQINLGNSINVSNSWLYFSHASDSSANGLNDFGVYSQIIDSNTLEFVRAGSGGTKEVRWYLIETPNAFMQQGTISEGTLSSQSVPSTGFNTPVDRDKAALMFSYYNTGSGTTFSNYLTSGYLASNNYWYMRREATGNSHAVSWHVVEYPEYGTRWNQSNLDIGTTDFMKNNISKKVTLEITGDNTNIEVLCSVGDCSRFKHNFTNGINSFHLQNYNINFTCNSNVSGNHLARFDVTSSKGIVDSLYISCNVNPDDIIPWFDPIPNNQNIEAGVSFEYDINASDNVAIYGYYVNDTINFEINESTGLLENTSLLPLGITSLNISINDTSNNKNWSLINVTVQDSIPPYFNPVPSDRSFSIGIPVYYDIDAYDSYMLDSYSVNDSTNFKIDQNTGVLENNTHLVLGIYKLNVTVNDTSNNKNWSVFIINITDNFAPEVIVDYPKLNGEAQKLEVMRISANISDPAGIDTAYVTIYYPNGTIKQLNLFHSEQDNYNVSFVVPLLSGQFNLTFFANDSNGNINNSVKTNFTVAELPISSKFKIEYGTTNFSDEQFLSSVYNMTLATVDGRIDYPNTHSIDVRNENYDDNVFINKTFISANLSALDNSFNSDVTLTFSNINCSMDIFVSNSFYYNNTAQQNIIDSGDVCSDLTSPACSNIQCVNNILTFDASYINSFALGFNTNLDTWDKTMQDKPFVHGLKVYPDNDIQFYANYTFTEGIEGNDVDFVDESECKIKFNNTPTIFDMIFNSSGKYWYYNTSFSQAGRYNYSISCNKTEYKSQEITKSFNIVIDDIPPWFNPIPTDYAMSIGSTLNYKINATDDVALDSYWINDTINFYINPLTGNISNITSLSIGNYPIEIFINDTSGNINSTNITISVVDYAPSCPNGISPCIIDSSQIRSRGNINPTPEPNAPNTIDSCNDGNTGDYQSDESLENITITSLNDTIFRIGDTVEINVTTYCYASGDNVNFVYTNSTTNIGWNVFHFIDPCPSAGFNTHSTKLVLDETIGMQAFRGIIQYNGDTTATCGSDQYDDNDDVMFYVHEKRDEENPKVFDASPIENSTYNYSDIVKITANVTDNKEIDTVIARITSGIYSEDLVLTDINMDGIYDGYFTETTIIGRYDVQIIANDTSSNINNTETTYFNIKDNQNLSVTHLSCNPDPALIGSLVVCTANVTDVYNISKVYANVTLPNGTIVKRSAFNISKSIFEFNISNTNDVGQYDILWWANNSRGTSRTDIKSFNVYENNIPNVTIIVPNDQDTFNTSDKVNITVNVTDDFEVDKVYASVTLPDNNVERVNLSNVGGNLYFEFLTATTLSGEYIVRIIANDTSNNINNSEFVTINFTYVTQSAKLCEVSPCIVDSSLIASRGSLTPPEPNYPNTIDSCSDGSSGTYQSDESLENITMSSLNGSVFNEGDTVEVNITAYCFGVDDIVKFVYSNVSPSVNWKLMHNENCPSSGFHTFTQEFVLDNSVGVHAFRGIVQYQGSATTTCGTGNYDDNDDFEFKVRDATPPVVLLDNPLNNEIKLGYNYATVDLTCNATDSFALQNISLYITNSSNQSFKYNSTKNIAGKFDQGIWSYDLPLGNYTYNCLAYDKEGNFDWGDSNFSFEISNIDNEGPTIVLIEPKNNTYKNSSTLNFTYVAYDYYSSKLNCSLNIDNLEEDYSENLNNTQNRVLVNGLSEGLNKWNVTCTDEKGNKNTSDTWNVTVDTVKPTIDFALNSDASGIVVTRDWLFVNVTQNDINYNHTIFRLYNKTDLILNIIRYDEFDTSINWTGLEDGMHFLNITVYDKAGNLAHSITRNVTIDTMGPQVTLTNLNNDPAGLGTNITFTIEIVEDSGLNFAFIEIENTIGEKNNYTLDYISGNTYQYKYKTYTNGTYNYKIYTQNVIGVNGNALSGSFDIYSNIHMQMRTMEDEYAVGEMINLTDPPLIYEPNSNKPIKLLSRNILTNLTYDGALQNINDANFDAAFSSIYRIGLFEKILNKKEKEDLSNNGIETIEYIGDFAYFIKIKNYSSIQNAYENTSLRMLPFDYEPSDKISPYLKNNFSKNISYSMNENISILITFFDGISNKEKLALLSYYSDDIIYEKGLDSWIVNLEYSKLEKVSSINTIKWIQKADNQIKITADISRELLGVETVHNLPYNLSGDGVVLALWDSGYVDVTHDDFQGRILKTSGSYIGDHPTNVAGAMAGDGSLSGGQYKGMAPGASILSYSMDGLQIRFSQLINEIKDASNNYDAILSQNSWVLGSCYAGSYETFAKEYDRIVRGDTTGKPMNVVFSAGNTGPSYDTVCAPSTGKNVITVGAVNKNLDVVSYSARGPMDDGRVKPDLVGGGVEIRTTAPGDTYENQGGTSLTSPVISGIIGLMEERYNQLGVSVLPSTNKAILIHTAKDLGNVGPDYTYGWGFPNATKAIDLINDDSMNYQLYEESELEQLDIDIASIYVPPNTDELKLTIVWDDYPGTTSSSKALINDLDLQVFDPSNGRHYPWTLNKNVPNDLAVRITEDTVNNVEQVVVDNPESGIWKIYVDGAKIVSSSQKYTIVSSHPMQIGKTTPEENQSKIVNYGPTDIGAFLEMTVDYYNTTSSLWQLDTIMVDELDQYIYAYQTIPLDLIFNIADNGHGWNSSNAKFGTGTYRVTAKLLDNESNVLKNIDGSQMNTSYNFSLVNDITPPRIELISPEDGMLVGNDQVKFQFNATDDYFESLTCYLTVNNTDVVTGIYAESGKITNVTYSLPANGDYYWNVTCVDGSNNKNTNTSQTWLLHYIKKPEINSMSLYASSVNNLSIDNLTCDMGTIVSSQSYNTLYNFYVDHKPFYDLYFSFDSYNSTNKTVIKDYSGSNNTGILNGDANGPKRFNLGYNNSPAYYFDGVDDYIKVPYDASTDYTSSLSIMAYIRLNQTLSTLTHDQAIISKESSYQLYLSSITQNLIFRIESADIDCSFNYPFNKDQLYMVTATYDGSNIKVYVDGNLENTCLSVDVGSSGDDLYIGSFNELSGFFNGSIDNIIMQSQVMTQTQINNYVNEDYNKVHNSMIEGDHNWTCSGFVVYDFVDSNETFSNDVYMYKFELPNITSIELNDEIDLDDEILLSAGDLKIVNCSGVAEIYGPQNSIIMNATIYNNVSSYYLDSDNMTRHYTNSSCNLDDNGDHTFNYTCSFKVAYFADAGNWNCDLRAQDAFGYKTSDNDTAEVMELIALNVSDDEITFFLNRNEENSGSKDYNISIDNNGNVEVDFVLHPYANNLFDGKSMNCTSGELTDDALRYSLNPNQDFISKTQLSSSGTLLDVNLKPAIGLTIGSSQDVYLGIESQGIPGNNYCKGYLFVSVQKS